MLASGSPPTVWITVGARSGIGAALPTQVQGNYAGIPPFGSFATAAGPSQLGGKVAFPICPACDSHALKAVFYC
jgi:hypothetical protein